MQSGFVYKWKNLTNGLLYIGKHRGTLDDGYITSSKIFNKEFNQQPSNFEREILWYSDNTDDSELCVIEAKYLSNIPNDEFYLRENCKYYNQLNISADPYTRSITKHGKEYDSKIKSERMAGNLYGKGNAGKPKSEEHKKNISQAIKKLSNENGRLHNGGRPSAMPEEETMRIYYEMGLTEGSKFIGISREAFKHRVRRLVKKGLTPSQ